MQMLEHQRMFDSIGNGVMQELGSAMEGAGVVRLARGGMKSQLLEGADVMRVRGVMKSQLLAGVDVAGMTRGVVKSHELLNRPGLRDMLRGLDAGAGRLALRSGAVRASGATAGLLAARALSAQVGPDTTRWTSPSARERLRRVGAGARFAGVGQPLARVWRDAGGDLHGALMRGYPMHQVMAVAAGAGVRDLHGITGLGLARMEFSALKHLTRSARWQTNLAEGLTSANHAALRALMAATVGRAPDWMAAYGGGSALQRLVQDAATRSGFGVTGLDVMRGRGIWDGAGVVRVHNALVGARSPWADHARFADLFAPGGAWAAADDETPTEAELLVPGPGDTLAAIGADVVLADALDGELVPARRLDVVWEWLCANPGHWVRAWNLVWPDASVHERNTLRRQAATVGGAHLGVAGAWLAANTVGVVVGLFALGLAWQALFDELSKLLSERDEQR